MLGLGWSEMLVIGVVVLIVVGPKDLPMMMRNVGRMMGTVRRMSNEFRREIDKAIAADEIRDARKAISDPLKQTSQDISREFNSIKNGKVEPSGKLAPSDPNTESVVEAIHAQAGMAPKAEPSAASAALRAKVSQTVAKPADEAVPVDQPAAKPKVRAAPRKPATTKAAAKTTETPTAGKAAKKTTAAKANGAKATASKSAAKAAAKPAAKAAKPAAKKAAAKRPAPADAGSEG